MSSAKFLNDEVFGLVSSSITAHAAYATDTDSDTGQARVVPRDLRQSLARLRLLEGVPFGYLVADSELSPPESIRYFYFQC